MKMENKHGSKSRNKERFYSNEENMINDNNRVSPKESQSSFEWRMVLERIFGRRRLLRVPNKIKRGNREACRLPYAYGEYFFGFCLLGLTWRRCYGLG